MYIRLIILFTFLFLHTTVFAQSTPKAYHSDRTTTHVGESLIVGSYGTAGVKITGSGTFEVTFQVKAFNTQSWDDVQCRNVTDASESTTASANGSWQCPVAGFGEFRVNLTTCTSCSVTATGYGTQAARGGGTGGGSGSVTSVSASGGVETASGSAITGSGTIRGATCIKHETGTTYTFLAADRGCIVTFSNADPVAATLPEAGSTGFEEAWYVYPVNLGAGTVTITPATSTIQGGSELDLTTGKGAHVVSDDTNYFYNPGLGLTAEAQGLGDVIAIDRTYGGAVSQATAPRFGSSATGRYWLPYDDPTDGLLFVCEIAGVLNDCDYIRKLASGKTWGVTDSSNASIFTLTESTGALTNVTLDASGTGNTVTSRFYWDADLCGVSPTDGTTTGHIWNRDPLSTAPSLTADVDTNVGRCYATFADDDTTYGVQITRHLPDGFVAGTLGADIWWNTTGTGNARFQIQTKCYADDEADDASFNTATVTTAAAGTSGRPNKQNVATIDTTGCVGGELIRIRFFRVRTEASDTLNAALNVEKVFFKGWDAQ